MGGAEGVGITLKDYTRREAPDMVVMGSRGLGSFSRWVVRTCLIRGTFTVSCRPGSKGSFMNDGTSVLQQPHLPAAQPVVSPCQAQLYCGGAVITRLPERARPSA